MISKTDVYREIPSPKKVEQMLEPRMFMLIYKVCYMILRLQLDTRETMVKMARGEKIEFKPRNDKRKFLNNSVIKDSDNLGA